MSQGLPVVRNYGKGLYVTKSFFLAAIPTGFSVGLYEGAILFSRRHALIHSHPVGPAIFLLAPFVDALAFGFLGGVLGFVAELCQRKFPHGRSRFITLGLAFAGAYLTFLPASVWTHARTAPSLVNVGIAVMGGLVVGIGAVQFWPMIKSRCVTVTDRRWYRSWSLMQLCAVLIGAALIGWAVARTTERTPAPDSQAQAKWFGGKRPNILMIALDTARADHFSAYGYDKPTTPNLDSLAQKGVLFETAVAPSSWTMPSFATVFTGLLLHQNPASWDTPLVDGSVTLASILRSRGYQTVGFNANYIFGTTRTGLAQGFDLYDDDDGSLLTDLANIGFVKAFWYFVYYPFIHPDYLQRRDARALNQAVFRWFRHRTKQPFFLFINYIDAHDPYAPIPEVGNRFGDATRTIAQRIRAEIDGAQAGIDVPRSRAEQVALIAEYDSGLAFADSQIATLLRLLESTPDGSNTYIIVFSDHGQAFGTHRHYGHGWGLNWELLHVPLIIAGPGIPQGRRVGDLVGLQQLFATVLDLSGANGSPPVRNSLRCSWTPSPSGCDSNPMVVSELGACPGWAASPSISVVTPEWHLVRDAAGDLQLYDLITDPEEEENLADSPERVNEVAALQQRLFERVQASSRPWLGEDYLCALGERQYSLLLGKRAVTANWPYVKARQPPAQDNELLRSLPYQ